MEDHKEKAKRKYKDKADRNRAKRSRRKTRRDARLLREKFMKQLDRKYADWSGSEDNMNGEW